MRGDDSPLNISVMSKHKTGGLKDMSQDMERKMGELNKDL